MCPEMVVQPWRRLSLPRAPTQPCHILKIRSHFPPTVSSSFTKLGGNASGGQDSEHHHQTSLPASPPRHTGGFVAPVPGSLDLGGGDSCRNDDPEVFTPPKKHASGGSPALVGLPVCQRRRQQQKAALTPSAAPHGQSSSSPAKTRSLHRESSTGQGGSWTAEDAGRRGDFGSTRPKNPVGGGPVRVQATNDRRVNNT